MENLSKTFTDKAAGAPMAEEVERANKDLGVEPLSEEALNEVAGGSFNFKDLYRICPAGMMVPRNKGCSSCRFYHETTTHWCGLKERKGKS